MLIAELKTRPNVILLQEQKRKYVLYPSNKKEVEELELVLEKISINNQFKFLEDPTIKVNMVGYKKDTKHNHVEDVIPTLKTHTNESKIEDKPIKEYQCYQEHKYNSNSNVIKHEDKLSSFCCALQLIKSDYFIVLEEEILEPK